MNNILTEAFRELKLLKEETFEGDRWGLDKMERFLSDDKLESGTVGIDPKAKTEDDLQNSYVGKVVFRCPSCGTFVYRDKDEIEFDEDSDLVNVSEECPYCHSVGGFDIIGEVAPYADVAVKVDDEVDGNKEESEEKIEVEESCGKNKKPIKEFLETVDSFKTWKYKDKTEQGWEVKKLYVDRDNNRLHVIVYRPKSGDYAVGIGYSPDTGDWNQGRYDFETFEDAEKSLKDDYNVSVYEKVEESVTSRSRDDIDAIADDKKEKAKARFMRKKDDADSDRDYQLKKNGLKESVEDNIIRGNPTITWKVEDEERYNAGEPSSDKNDLAAYAAYLADQAGEKLYAFGGMDDESNTMLLDITGDGNLQKYSFVRGRLRLEECDLKESDKPAATSIEDAQKWVDFDMKRYGRISNRTNELVKKAGFQIVKDDHGDYEVVAGHFESLDEARDLTKTPGTIAKLLNDHMDEINQASTSVPAMKAKLKEIVNNSDLASTEAAKKFNTVMDSKKNVAALLSTIATYMTGIKSNESLGESFDKVEIETAAEKIKVSSEPKEEEVDEEKETIAPLTDETADNIIDTALKDEDKDVVDVDVSEFDTDEIEELGESFLKRVYENVQTFKVTSGKFCENGFLVEGVINFNSGKQLNSTFKFTPAGVTKTGKIKLIGENLSITKRNNAFTLTGKINNGKLLSESLTYNYSAKTADNKAQRVYGRVTRNK